MFLLKQILVISICIIGIVNCWDSQEMQMFDLVEEVKDNFYDFLGVSQNATISEIGKAYRKLTLRYHPDKNPGTEYANKFRYLVAIYEILKDEQMRERYHDVLKHGLPDWRMPSFYYRKLRKMSLFEIILLFSILATAIHYACLWGVYIEKKLVQDANLSKKSRRTKIQERKKEKEDDNGDSDAIPKPGWKDILPLALARFSYSVTVSIPFVARQVYFIIKKELSIVIEKKMEEKRKIKEKEEERKKINELKKQKKERKMAHSKEHSELRKMYELAQKKAMLLPVESFSDLPADIDEREHREGAADTDNVEHGPWTDKHTVLLVQALKRYPAGVKERWTRISEMVGRPISEVTSKVKEIQQRSREGKIPIQPRMQSSLGEGVAESIELEQQQHLFIPSMWHQSQSDSSHSSDDDSDQICSKTKAQLKKERKQKSKQTVSTVAISKPVTDIPNNNDEKEDEEAKENENECNVSNRKKPRTKASYLDQQEQSEASECIWTQAEQKQLEDAIRMFPNGTTNRWDRISHCVPTKTKTQCVDRIKKLSQEVHLKKSIKT